MDNKIRKRTYTHGRILVGGFALALLGLVTFSAPSSRAAGQPCLIARGDSPVARACADGGVAKAKQTMRSMMKAARDAGTRFVCDDCHADTERFEQLTPQAKSKFARLLAAVGN